MVLGIFYFQKYKGHGDGDEQNVMPCLGPDRPGQTPKLDPTSPNVPNEKKKMGPLNPRGPK